MIQRLRAPPHRGHLGRAFCCAVLLRAAAIPECSEYFGGENEMVVRLLASALALGDPLPAHVLSFLCWRISSSTPLYTERPFCALGILLLHAALFNPEISPDPLRELCEWVEAEEADARQLGCCRSNSWLFGLTFFNQSHHIWKALVHDHLLNPPAHIPDSGATQLRQVAARVLEAG